MSSGGCRCRNNQQLAPRARNRAGCTALGLGRTGGWVERFGQEAFGKEALAMRPTIASLTLITLAPVLGAVAAQAQTSATRQITREPVETIVTQGPNGVAVTRRILTPEPGTSTYLPPPPAYPTVATQAVEAEDYIEPAPPPRRVTTTTTARTVGQAPARTRTV